MLFKLILFIIAIWLAYEILRRKENFEITENNEVYMSRPNCFQLNDERICRNTPGCYQAPNGCISMWEDIQEPKKPWEKDDFLVVY